MSFRRVMSTARGIDKRWQRWRSPDRRRVLVNARTAMNDSTVAPIVERLPRGARRVQTFHGVAGKYRTVYDSPSESMRSWDRLFFINERRLQHFIDCGAID